MAATTYMKLLFLVILFCFLKGGYSGISESGYLQVPVSEFEGKVGSTIDVIQQLIPILSGLLSNEEEFTLGNAISDCLELMDFSVDLLSSALAISKNETNGNITGNPIDKMKCKLSAALINQDTCKQGFVPCTDKGSEEVSYDDHTQKSITDKLDQATSLIQKLLTMVKPKSPTTRPSKGGSRKFIKDELEFPDWLSTRDQKLLQSGGDTVVPNAVVATDGTGNYKTITEAIDNATERSTKRYVIYIKRGVYQEYVRIDRDKWNIMLVGDGIDATVITGSRSCQDGWKTYCSATFGVKGERFMARDITFQNTAGPEMGQAVAFVSDSHESVLYRCSFKGYQDTLYPHACSQFYKECKITGTVDFIFGHATAVFQNCEITARKGLPNQVNTITANGRNQVDESGFSLQFCTISADADVASNSIPTYLGRPWKQYSRTVIMQSYISEAIRPEGWLPWNGKFALDTLFYGEFNNSGPGSKLGARVKWPGYHVITDPNEAMKFTVDQFIKGADWLPLTGVNYTPGL